MREIKFRAWDGERMGVVTSIHSGGNPMVQVVTDWQDGKGYHWRVRMWPVSDIKLMQFTGLHDKNGVEIYEGDMVKFIDTYDNTMNEGLPMIGFVDFDNASFLIRSEVVSHYRWTDYEVEVLGNIHENPDLLEM